MCTASLYKPYESRMRYVSTFKAVKNSPEECWSSNFGKFEELSLAFFGSWSHCIWSTNWNYNFQSVARLQTNHDLKVNCCYFFPVFCSCSVFSNSWERAGYKVTNKFHLHRTLSKIFRLGNFQLLKYLITSFVTQFTPCYWFIFLYSSRRYPDGKNTLVSASAKDKYNSLVWKWTVRVKDLPV